MDPFTRDGSGVGPHSDEHLELATVGGLLVNELVANSRGMVDKPMTIHFVSGGPTVVPYRLDEAAPAKGPVEGQK